MFSAWLEIIVGAVILTAPALPCRLLFGAEPDGVAMPLAHLAGIALLALGIACLPSMGESHRNAVLGLFAYNAGAAILFTWVGVATKLGGLLLWPAAVLHGVIGAALLPLHLAQRSGISPTSLRHDPPRG